MAIIAKLYVNGRVYKVLRSKQGIIQLSDETGRPTSRPFHTGLLVVIEATQDTLFFEKVIHPTQQIQEIILEYTDSTPGRRTRRIRFVDCYITLDHTEFRANGKEPLTETILITAAGIEDSHSQGKYTTPRRETEFLSEQTSLITQEEEIEPIKVIDVDGPFDEAGNKIKYISPKHEYYYHATLKNYEEEDDLNQIQWTATYDAEDATQQLTTGGTYEDGLLKTPIQINKGKQTATIYAHIGSLNPNVNTKVTYKQVVTFFIGGAGDKEPFYTDWKTEIVKKDVRIPFDKNLSDTPQYLSEYLSYKEVNGTKDIQQYVASKILNKDGTQINIVGHSLGGWNGAHLSQILTDMGYSVNTLITLDPVGELTQVTLISDIHFSRPKPKAEYWINIYTDPANYEQDDIIADLGGQWIPKWHTPHIMHTSIHNHGNAKEMFTEVLSKKTISASSLLLTAIQKYIETK